MRVKLVVILSLISSVLLAGNENYMVGAGPAGMANAYVMYSGIWSTYHNQAGLARLENMTTGFYFENRYGISELGVQSFAISAPFKSGNFGFSVTHFGYSEYNENKFGLAYAHRFGDKFSAGIQFDYFYLHLPADYGNRGTFVVEAGFLAEPVDKLSLGVHVFNPTRTKIADFQDERIPTIMRAGLGYAFTENLNFCIETEKDLDQKARFKTGIEYVVINDLVLRAGIATNPNQNYFGIGYKLKNFTANMTFSTNPVLPMSTHMSIIYTFH
jgi:hypothetical protein